MGNRVQHLDHFKLTNRVVFAAIGVGNGHLVIDRI